MENFWRWTNRSRPEIAVYDFDPSTGLVSSQRVVTILPDPTWQRTSFAATQRAPPLVKRPLYQFGAIDNYGGAISAIVRFFRRGLLALNGVRLK
ncbi:MAG: hypothetical protein IPG73_07335 [Ignavibacteria bacterium]|nr:hypothetical protein [Ignavibacteria bacterium]